MLTKVCEYVFEELSRDDPAAGRTFFADFPDAVGRDGKDLSHVVWAFLAAELREMPEQEEAVQWVIESVIAGMDLLASGEEWPDALTIATAVEDITKAAAWCGRLGDSIAHSATKAAYNAYAAYDTGAAFPAFAAYAVSNAADASLMHAADAAAMYPAFYPARYATPADAAHAIARGKADSLLSLIKEA